MEAVGGQAVVQGLAILLALHKRLEGNAER